LFIVDFQCVVLGVDVVLMNAYLY